MDVGGPELPRGSQDAIEDLRHPGAIEDNTRPARISRRSEATAPCLRYACHGMRCPSCGTENAPDSRFCGGCGARFGPPSARVAPTQKISDDDSFPQTQTGSPSPAQAVDA